jgi:hypothetical protein
MVFDFAIFGKNVSGSNERIDASFEKTGRYALEWGEK